MLNKRIRDLRMAHSMNQVEFAKRLSVTKQTVSNWENNNIMPSIDMLIKIADFFNTTTDFMLGRSVEKSIDVSGLTDEQIAHINWLIKDLKKKEKNLQQ